MIAGFSKILSPLSARAEDSDAVRGFRDNGIFRRRVCVSLGQSRQKGSALRGTEIIKAFALGDRRGGGADLRLAAHTAVLFDLSKTSTLTGTVTKLD